MIFPFHLYPYYTDRSYASACKLGLQLTAVWSLIGQHSLMTWNVTLLQHREKERDLCVEILI